MEKTNFTFVSPRVWMGALSALFVLLGLQSAMAQCPAPTGLTTLNIGQNSATLRWTSNSTPTDNCWTVTVGGQGLASCNNAGQATIQTTVCYINNVVSFSAPVTGMTVVGSQISVTVNGLQPGTDYEFHVAETCDGIGAPLNVSACAGPAAFITLDAQYTVSATTVRPTCPFISPGYVANGSFTVTVTDGTTCAGTYTVNATPVAGSGPAGSTPPLTTTVTYIGFPQGAFLFSNAGAGCYTVTVTETGSCNPPTDPVVIQVCVPDGIDNVQPLFYVTDVLGNILADNDPLTAAGVTRNFGTVAVPEGECGRQDEYYVYGFDNCDGFIVANNAVSASAATVPGTIQPGTQVSVTPDGFGFYLVDVHWSTGTSTVTILGRDAAGNIANNPAGLQLIMNVPDNTDPVVTILSNTQFTIPVCATSVTGIVTFQVDDLCDQDNVNFANLIVNFGGATGALNFTGNNYREYLVTFPAAGTYLLSASYTDANGNTGFIDQVIQVQLAAANQPPTIQANAETVTLASCQTGATIVYSFTISDDCAPINIAQVQFNGGGSGLPNLNGAGFFFTDPVGPNTVYFEVQGTVGPAGTYFPLITYQGVTANPTLTVIQNANQPADIVLPAINVTIPQCQTEVDVIIPITITDDCDNPVVPARASFTLGGVAITPDFINAAAGYFEFGRTLTAANNGQLLVATYTDAQGAVRTVDAIITVNAQPDTWAPIIVYPSQDIIVALDPCGPSSATVVFEATATDNCGVATFNANFTPGVTGASIVASAGGSRIAVITAPGTYTVLLTATDVFGNVRQEDFRIIVTQAPRPQTNLACNDNINVTLNANCQALIIPDMVLEGNPGCLTDNDFVVTVVDGNVNNGNIVDGCGTFNYNVALAIPAPTVGFTGQFAPANWTTTPSADGASVSFTPSVMTLITGASGPLDGNDPNIAEVDAAAAIAMPSNGNVRFDYAWTNVDVNFDWFIIGVNGTVVLSGTANTAGTFNQNLTAGQVLLVGIDDDGIAPAGQQLLISGFVFTPSSNLTPGDFTTCWGTLTAEDKTKPVLTCPTNKTQGTFLDDAHVIQGTLATTDPTQNFFNYACLQEFFTANQTVPGNYRYDTYTFTVSEDDAYTFFFNSTAFNGVAALYEGAYDPNNPCENIIAQSDDQVNFGGTIYFVVGIGFAQGNNPDFRFSHSLVPGRTYTLLTTTEGPNTLGAYSWTVRSDGTGVLVGVPTQQVGITGDLVCTDKDVLNINNLPLNVPRCYKTDRLGNVILPTNAQQRALLQQLLTVMSYTGYPNANQLTALGGAVTDNCGFIEICVQDVVTDSDCGDAVITRTFTARDKQDGDYVAPNTSPCTGQPNISSCSHTITIRKANLLDVNFPPFTAVVECDQDYPVDANGNPHPDLTGYIWVNTVFGLHDLNDAYCNLAASYFDYPRAQVCESTYKFRREWTLFNWCNPGAGRIMNQIIKVGDFTGPEIECPVVDNNWDGIPDLITYSTGPFNCTAAFAVPMPTITDNCSSWTLLTEIVTTIQAPVYNQWGQQIGTTPQDVVVATIPHGANRFVSNIPVGCHRFRYTATDDCDKVSTIECIFQVEDLIEPIAACDDDLNISIGGQGLARIYAEDIDEGSSDNCGPIRIEIRRTYTVNPNTCAPIATTTGAEENGALPWGNYVDFTCCDVNQNVRIELRVWDDRNGDGIPGNTIPVVQCDGSVKQVTDNNNICWLDVLIEDKIRPFCTPPHAVTVDCDDLPYDFDPTDTLQLQELFGDATGVDNCPNVSVRELPPSVNLHDCGFGFITRAFRVTDAQGNISTNSCTQTITINEVHNYEIKFPKDESGQCGPLLFDTTIVTNELGCDLLAVSVYDETFEASGDECYKIFRTFRVLNWCEYDGTSQAKIVSRDEDCDGFTNAALVGDEDVWVLVRPNGVTYYDRDNNELNTNPPAFNKGTQCDGITNPTGHWINSIIDINATRDPITGVTNNSNNPNLGPNDNIRNIESVGFWQYTQIIKVYDNVKPVVNYEPTDPFCSINNVTCAGPVEVPFSIDENCTPDDLTIKVFLDAFNDGVLDGNVTAQVLSGTYPDYVLSGVYPIGEHAFEVHVEDGCGNFTAEEIPFSVVDCKAPVPVCINGLAIELMPTEPDTDADGDGDIDAGAMAIWASDFLVSLPGEDCTGPIKYSIHKSDDVVAGTDIPSPDQTGIVLTCDDLGTVIVRIYAWDSAFNPYAVQPDGTVGGPNFDWCETYILVQDNMFDLCSGSGSRIAGLIETEESEAVADVEVSLSGNTTANTTTPANGTYGFDNLATGPQGDYTVAPELDAFPLNGVSTFDLVLISRHILGVQPLGSPYKMIAADVNNDKKITTIDLIHLRKLILAIDTEFASNTSWRFVRADYNFPVATNPWFEVFPEVFNVNDLATDILNADFVAVKIGDVNSSAATSFASVEPRTIEGVFAFEVADQKLTAGNEYTVTFKASEIAKIQGYQGTLTFNKAAVELVNIEYGAAKEDNFGMRYAAEGMITTSWNGEATASDVLFSLVLRAKTDAQLSEVLGVSSQYTVAEAYNQNDGTTDVAINFGTGVLATAGFELYQNTPNPFKGETLIGFNLPEDAEVTISIQDVTGKVLRVTRGQFVKGYNKVTLNSNDLGAVGVLSYTVTTADFTATKQMIIVE